MKTYFETFLLLDFKNCYKIRLLKRSSKIQKLKVDPINGLYLWIEESGSKFQILSWDWKCDPEPRIIISEISLGDYVVLPEEGKILVPDLKANQLLEVKYTSDSLQEPK